MDPNLIAILSNFYLWVIVVSVIGGYIALRIANGFRDRAAFADYPDSPEHFVLRARIWYGIFVVFLLAMIGSLGIVIFQVLQIARPTFQLPGSLPAESTRLPSDTPAPTATMTPGNISRTATPAPTDIPLPTPSPTLSNLTPARIGNTNFQGANVRAEPGVKSGVVAKLQNGSMVFITDQPVVVADEFTWQQVRLEDGRIGWIVSWFLITIKAP